MDGLGKKSLPQACGWDGLHYLIGIMTTSCFIAMKARSMNLFGQFVTSGSGMAPSEEGIIPVMVACVLGAFGGLLSGYMLARILRFVSFATGRSLGSFGGYKWVIYGALTGAVLCGVLAAGDGKD